METTRKTGLGSSLLLQRTEPPVTQPVVEPNVQTPAKLSPAPASAPVPTKASSASTRKPKKQKARVLIRDRCTIYLDQEVNGRLDIVARIEGRERSEIVSEILKDHLPKYRVELE